MKKIIQKNNKLKVLSKKCITLILTIVMVFAMMPGLEYSKVYASTYNLANPRVTSEKTTWDCIYFGNYKQSSDGAGGFKTEPIKWRVLSVEGNDAFLLADKNIDGDIPYNEEDESITWKDCTMRLWLNSIFKNTAFTATEQNAIMDTTVVNADNPEYGTEGGDNTIDKIYLLSIGEVTTKKYGFSTSYYGHESREAVNTAYTASKSGMYSAGTTDCWWLRSPGGNTYDAAGVNDYGYVYNYGKYVDYNYYAVRPALHLNLSSNVWSHAGTVTSAGQESEQREYTDVTEVPTSQTESTDSISLFDDAKGSVGNKPIAKVFPGDYSLKFPATKFKLKKESNYDGTYKIKAEIGLKDNAALGSDKAFSKFKKDFENARKNLQKVDKLRTLLNTWGAKSRSFTVSKGFKPSLDVIGYYEATISETGKIIRDEGGIIVSAKGEYKYTQQVVIAPIPVPFYAEIGGKVEAKGKANLKKLVNSNKPEMTGTLSINPSLFAGVGAGVCELASLGVRGSAGLDMQIIPKSKGDLTAELSIQYKLILVIDGELKIAKAKYPLWPKKTQSLTASTQSNILPAYNINYKFANRNYQKKTTSWNGLKKHNNFLGIKSENNNNLDSNVLQEYIMPNSIPMVNSVYGKKVLIFQANDENRTEANSAVLRYSIYENGNWSEPKAIQDDGTLDTFFDSKVIDDDLYVTWQKCNSVIDNENVNEALSDISEKSEIFVAKFSSNTGKFDDVWRITNNSYLDGIPKLVDCNGKPGIVWMRNENNSVIDTTGTKKIYSSIFDGESWSTEEKLSQVVGTIGELTGIYSDSNITAYYTVNNADGTQQTFCRNNEGSSKALQTNTDKLISGLKVFDNKLNYVKEGNIEAFSNSDDTESVVKSVDENRIGANAKRYRVGSKDAILWMSNDDDGCAFYSSVYNGEKYGIPVEIYRDNNNIGKMFDAIFNPDGNWDIVYTGQSMSDGSKTSMFYVNKKEEEKLALNDVLINEYELSAGSQPIQYSVTNTGEETVTKLILNIIKDSNLVLNKTVECFIAPGETAYFEDQFAVCDSGNVKVQVFAQNQEDMTDTAFNEDVEYNNFSVDVEKSVSYEAVSFVATVKNTGTKSHSGTISFYKDSNAKDLLETRSFETLAPGESSIIKFVYSTDNAVINTEDACPCSIKVEAGEEFDETDNIWCGITYLWEFPQDTQDDMNDNCHIHNLEKTDARNATCLSEGNIEYWTCEDCNKIFGDECGNGVIELKDTVIEKHDHSINHVPATEATQTTDGNFEYWYCSECNKYYKNENATVEYSGVSWKIPKTGDSGSSGGSNSGGEATQPEEEKNIDISDLTVDISSGDFIYHGGVQVPSIVVKDKDGKIIESKYYSVQYNNPKSLDVGEYTVTVTMKDLYSGSKTFSYKINPKGAKISSVRGLKKAITVKWKKQRVQTTGYHIRYSLKTSMKESKTLTVKSNKTGSIKLKKLKTKKKYYVQLRTYKTVNGQYYYSAWSAKKSVKTK